jgi:hypothetical protein
MIAMRTCFPIAILSLLSLFLIGDCQADEGEAQPCKTKCWDVNDVRAGMKGEGRTVLKGTKIQTFQAEILGVMKNTSPGRDLILCRLSGLDLDKTGVIAGMSGSPVYIDGKLLGAVAYAWPFGKEPIAGITPFCQMHQYAESFEQKDLADAVKSTPISLLKPLRIGGQEFDKVTVSDSFEDPQASAADGLFLVPLRTPLAATGFTPHSLTLLKDRLKSVGMVPMQGGGVTGAVAEKEKDTPLQAGGALTVALVLGDFDLSGIGTVTQIEGKRVYGWGHPFMGLGECEFPLMTGYVHTIYPRQTLSFKMGSPLKTVGTINADVSTCIAGWLDREPDLLPVSMIVKREPYSTTKSFKVRVVRQKMLMPTLVFTSLTNSVDMEGQLPEEMTAVMKARIEIDGRDPIILSDTYSGYSYSGGRAPRNLYSQVAAVLQILTTQDFAPLRIKKVDCITEVKDGQKTADITEIQLSAKVYRPGDTVKATVFLKPNQGAKKSITIALKLPKDLPDGVYSAKVMNEVAHAERRLVDDPNLGNPQDLDQLLEALKIKTNAKRTHLVLRVPLDGVGVALNGKSLSNLPPSMVHIFANGKRTGAQPLAGCLHSELATDWVLNGQESVSFRVDRHKHRLTTD